MPERIRLGVCALLMVCCAPAWAQEAEPPLIAIDGQPPAETATHAAPGPTPEVEALQSDISVIKQDLKLLQETLDLIVNRMMADLEKENAQLRDEVRRLQEYGPAPGGMVDGGFVPRPGAEVFEELAQESLAEQAPAGPPPFTWEPVEEWGRDPETATKAKVNSLKGMVVLVPPGSLREDIENLARELRSEYEAYDNINIEFFDEIEAARSYADRQVADPNHRILSISKHKASGRDKILFIGGQQEAQEVPTNGTPADPAAEPEAPTESEAPPAVEEVPTAPPLVAE